MSDYGEKFYAEAERNTEPRKPKGIKDDDGFEIKEGDVVGFSYGIPPIGVKAPIVKKDGELYAITEGHKPPQCKLRLLRKHVGSFYKEPPITHERIT